MDITPYKITYRDNEMLQEAEVRPCCREDNVVDYSIYVNDQLAFNIRKSPAGMEKWVVSLKNADDDIDDEMIQRIGLEIDQHAKKHNR